MTTRASATFEVKAWDEKLYDEFDGGRKLTRASVKKSFHGDIEGESSMEYLITHLTQCLENRPFSTAAYSRSCLQQGQTATYAVRSA